MPTIKVAVPELERLVRTQVEQQHPEWEVANIVYKREPLVRCDWNDQPEAVFRDLQVELRPKSVRAA